MTTCLWLFPLFACPPIGERCHASRSWMRARAEEDCSLAGRAPSLTLTLSIRQTCILIHGAQPMVHLHTILWYLCRCTWVHSSNTWLRVEGRWSLSASNLSSVLPSDVTREIVNGVYVCVWSLTEPWTKLLHLKVGYKQYPSHRCLVKIEQVNMCKAFTQGPEHHI